MVCATIDRVGLRRRLTDGDGDRPVTATLCGLVEKQDRWNRLVGVGVDCSGTFWMGALRQRVVNGSDVGLSGALGLGRHSVLLGIERVGLWLEGRTLLHVRANGA